MKNTCFFSCITALTVIVATTLQIARADTLDVYWATTLKRRDVRAIVTAATQLIYRDTQIMLTPRYRQVRLRRMRTDVHPIEQFRARANRLQRGNRMLLITQPFDKRTQWGAAEICGQLAVVSVARDTVSDSGYGMAIYGTAHELGHLLGATHTRSTDIMFLSPVDLAYRNNWNLGFSSASNEQMHLCTNRVGYIGGSAT